jgi:hypothetical protein
MQPTNPDFPKCPELPHGLAAWLDQKAIVTAIVLWLFLTAPALWYQHRFTRRTAREDRLRTDWVKCEEQCKRLRPPWFLDEITVSDPDGTFKRKVCWNCQPKGSFSACGYAWNLNPQPDEGQGAFLARRSDARRGLTSIGIPEDSIPFWTLWRLIDDVKFTRFLRVYVGQLWHRRRANKAIK